MEIRISKMGHSCSGCSAPFQHLEKVRSVAARTDTRTLERLDFCAVCAHRASEHETYCSWVAVYRDPEIIRQSEEDPESQYPLRRIFYAYSESTDRDKNAVAFLAAEMLRRQRGFKKIRESQEEGDTRVIWYLDRSGNRIIEVRDPSFSYAELDKARITLLEEMKAADTEHSRADASGHGQASAPAEPISSPEDMP